jgi:PAS domain S-box-containing protein
VSEPKLSLESQSIDLLFKGDGELSELMRRLNWSATPLGAPESWPQSLRSIVQMMLTSRYQMWLGWGPQLAFLYNDAYRPTMGVKHPWGLARPASVVWKEIWGDIGPLIEQVLRTGKAIYHEGMLLLLERSGFPEETYHTFSYSPLFDDAGTIAGMFCVVIEESERVINDRRLATLRGLASAAAATNSEEMLFRAVRAQLSTNLHDLPFSLCYVLDRDSSQVRLVAATGVPEQHVVAPSQFKLGEGPWPFEAVADGTPTLVVDGLADRFETLPCGAWDRGPRQALIVPIAQQGQEKSAAGFFIAGINPYRTLDQQYRGFVELVAGQIGAALANARAYEAESQRARALAEIDRAKTTFFSNVSHEFRTPLTLLLGPLEHLLNSEAKSEQETRAQLQLAQRNGVRLLRLVNALLDFSRIEAGRVRASYEPTELAGFTMEIASSFRSAIEKAGLRLNVVCTELAEPVFVDKDMWEKIILNLLSNAFKSTFEGHISVTVRPSADRRAAEIEVCDTGIGVPPEEIPRLFERFHRVAGARGRSFEGSGIGLSLVQELVRLHGGTIAVRSALEQGTAFTICIPFGSSHLPPEQVRSSTSTSVPINAQHYVEEALRWLPASKEDTGVLAALPADAAERGRAALQGVGRRIVLADDNADMRDYVRRLLTNEGYAVDAVENGQLALESARIAPPDLILTDVMMPQLDGFGLLRAIRQDPRLGGMPVLMLSARAGEEAKIEGLDAGADDYLVKPFAARELLARVNTNIQMAFLRRESARALMQSEQRFLMTQERLTLALSTGRVAVYDWDVDTDRLSVQGPLAEIFGVTIEDARRGLPLQDFLNGIHPEDRENAAALVANTVQTGAPFEAEYRTNAAGEIRTVLSRGRIETKPSGSRFFSGVLIDITEQKAAEDALRAQTQALRILNQAATSMAADLELDRVAQTIIDAAMDLTKASLGAFVYPVVTESGKRNIRYAFPAGYNTAPGLRLPQNEQELEADCSSTGVRRWEDVTVASDTAGTMDSGSAGQFNLVRSYLAMPLRSRAEERLGVLYLGHHESGAFDSHSEELMMGLAAQASVAVSNAHLFQLAQRQLDQRRTAEVQLQAMNSTLEQRVETEVAERIKAEEALRQAQKMEAIGQLTGGIAHDFNNLLTVIIGGLDTIARSKSGDEARIQRATNMALQGAQRAANLTGRLLAFSRRQPLNPKPLDLNVLVRDMTDLLHRTIGETIELEGVLAPRLWRVELDQNQLESAILNLAVNARDAMPDGGKLTLETANTALDEGYTATDAEVIPGQYVLLAVSDTGCGMSKEILARAFEPFYTTKAEGRGTGLGLSMVYGFVKQSGGHVTIYSEPGHGTTVKLYFPRFTGAKEETTTQPALWVPKASRGEVILVVEDNDDVRAYSVMILNELGYGVLEAPDAIAALEVLRRAARVDLLFTDVILPGDNGRILADTARAERPGLRVLYTTGYSRNAIVHHGRLDSGVNLISKPFTFEQLAARVRDVLDRDP